MDDEIISIKGGRISFNAKFVANNNLKDSKYVFMSKPNIAGKHSIRIGFLLAPNRESLPNKNPLKLTKHPKVDRFTFTPKKWFDVFNIPSKDVEGNYSPTSEEDSRYGTWYIIEVEPKK